MSRPFQFSLRTLLLQATLWAIGLACIRLIGGDAGRLADACLAELAAISIGAAYGILFGKARVFAMLAGVAATPIARNFVTPLVFHLFRAPGGTCEQVVCARYNLGMVRRFQFTLPSLIGRERET